MIATNIAIVKNVNCNVALLSINTACLIIGYIIVILFLISLGKSFAVTPMKSTLKTKSIHTYIRHPMYLGESIMIITCAATSHNITNLPILTSFILCTILRIKEEEEEKELSSIPEYNNYQKSTRWRLIPVIW